MKKKFIDRLHERFALSSLGVTETKEEINKWVKFIHELPETKDCYELSYYRFCCRMYYFSIPKKIIMNIFGVGAMMLEIIYMITAKEKLREPIRGLTVIEKARDIPDFSDIIPEELLKQDNVAIIENHNEKFGKLCIEAKKMLWNCIKKHPFSFFYIYFVYMELMTHSAILLEQNPEITVVYINERNVALPILNELYSIQGRKLYSFMHGEYPLQLINAFMSFTRYYIWDSSYEAMFQDDLRCNIAEYIVYTPQKLRKKWMLEDVIPNYYCTYYFSGEDEKTTKAIVQNLIELSNCGRKCKVRPHPRNVLHKKLLEELLQNTPIDIESTNQISLEESLGQTQYAVGLQSTVLSEAYAEGREIVLDDKSNEEHFETLKAQKFNLFWKKHRLFSDLIKESKS